MTAVEMRQVLKWYAKRKIRELCPSKIADQLLGGQGAVHQLWSIGIVTGESPLSLRHAPGTANPVLTREHVSDVRALFVADPFLLRANSLWHMFFEVYNFDTDRGEIAWATSSDGFTWAYQKVVLRESFHLSYPYVFEWQGRYYMIPEAHQTESVRLYEARSFPSDWECTNILLQGHRFNDSSLFFYGDRWWLLSETNPALTHDTLRLYHAPHFRGPWQEHPQSPIIQGNPHIARPAGRVVVLRDRVLRFTQDCSPIYGTKVQAFEVTELTPFTYREQPASRRPLFGPSWRFWTQGGMHHIDPLPLDSRRWIAAVDGWRQVGWPIPDGWKRAKC
jgi:hypothetical protein